MKKIFIGIPTCRRYEPFWKSMDEFIPLVKNKYEIMVCTVHNKPIAEARNIIVDRFLESDSDYLLFLDDDHSGHNMDMLQAILDPILNNNSYMCGIKCQTKVFPYNSNLLIYSNVDEKKLGIQEGSGKYIPIEIDHGYMYCDLVGFGMTILTRMAFKVIEEPYFCSNNNVKEDNYFCDKLVKMGIHPVGCFDYILEHNGIGKHNYMELKNKGMSEIIAKHPDMKILVS